MPASNHLEDLPLSGTALQIPTKSEFFRLHPEHHEAEFLPISASQLSEYPHPDSEQELPPAQFEVISSELSSDIVLDSQLLIPASSFSPKFNRGARRPLLGISQTTIPDSQEPLTQSSESVVVEVPATADPLDQAPTQSPKPSQTGVLENNTSSGSSIPPRQPDNNLASSFESFSIAATPDHQPISSQGLHLLSSSLPQETHTAAQAASSRHSFQFLTQEPFDLGDISLSSNFKSQSQPFETEAGGSNLPQQSTQPVLDTVLDPSPQPAQRVSPLIDHPLGLISQSQLEFLPVSQDQDIVLDTPQTNCRRGILSGN